jgi:hypothetical protein
VLGTSVHKKREKNVTDLLSHETNFRSFSGCRLWNGFRAGESFRVKDAGVWTTRRSSTIRNGLQAFDSILADGLFTSCESACGKGRVARFCECGNEQASDYLVSVVNPTRCSNSSNLFCFWGNTTCFRRSFHPSSGVQDCTYSNRHMSNRYCCLLLAADSSICSVAYSCQFTYWKYY